MCIFCVKFDSGGIEVTFSGTNLDVVQDPVMAVNDSDYVDVFNVSTETMLVTSLCPYYYDLLDLQLYSS